MRAEEEYTHVIHSGGGPYFVQPGADMKRRKRTMLLLAIFAGSLMTAQLAGCAMVYRQMKHKMMRNYQEGIALYSRGKYADALDRFETVQSIDPEYGNVRRYILITKDALTKRAREYYEKGMQKKRSGDYEEALDMFLLVVKEDENYRDTRYQIQALRDTRQIRQKFENSVRKATAWYNRAQFQRAYGECLKAKKYNPDSLELLALMQKVEFELTKRSRPYLERARNLYEKNMYIEAKRQLGRALYVNPWDVDAKELMNKCNRKIYVEDLYRRAKVKYNQGDMFAAFDLFNEVNERERGYRDSERYLAVLSERLGRSIPQYYEKGVSYYDNERFSEAIVEFNRILKINPNHQKAREYRERALAKLELKRSLGAD